jgi:putative zinc finger protein
MTGSTPAKGTMRHIPEDELHAYLDQGLSRSQCVEIESHLAACSSCQAARDGIAALRDRTTALLTKLAPPRSFPPEFESLRRRAASQVSARRRRIQIAMWAASLVAAVGLGWTASFLLRPAEPVTRLAAAPIVAMPALDRGAPLQTAVRQNTPAAQRTRRRPIIKPAATEPAPLPAPVVPPPALELSSIDIPRSDVGFELDGMWRTMSWAGAQEEAGDKLPHIDGLPVVQVQVQTSEQGKQPLMVVAQQLSSGEVIRTIEGPTSDVSHLLARRAMSDPVPSRTRPDSAPRDSAPAGSDHTDRTMAMQRGDRMLVITGALPSDSLLAMIRRLNAEMRSK